MGEAGVMGNDGTGHIFVGKGLEWRNARNARTNARIISRNLLGSELAREHVRWCRSWYGYVLKAKRTKARPEDVANHLPN